MHPGDQLKAMLERAIKWAKKQREAAESMTAAWSRSVPSWRRMLIAYKNNQSNPNPFEAPDPSTFIHTMYIVRRANRSTGNVLDKLKEQLAEEDLKRRKSGILFPHKMTPADFLQSTLKVEEAQ